MTGMRAILVPALQSAFPGGWQPTVGKGGRIFRNEFVWDEVRKAHVANKEALFVAPPYAVFVMDQAGGLHVEWDVKIPEDSFVIPIDTCLLQDANDIYGWVGMMRETAIAQDTNFIVGLIDPGALSHEDTPKKIAPLWQFMTHVCHMEVAPGLLIIARILLPKISWGTYQIEDSSYDGHMFVIQDGGFMRGHVVKGALPSNYTLEYQYKTPQKDIHGAASIYSGPDDMAGTIRGRLAYIYTELIITHMMEGRS